MVIDEQKARAKDLTALKGKNYADICDRCGTVIGGMIDNYPAKWMQRNGCQTIRGIGIGVICRGRMRPLDLCDKCAKELTKWMLEPKEV